MKASIIILITAILSIAVISFETKEINHIEAKKVFRKSSVSLFCPECPILIPKVPLEGSFVAITEFDALTDLMPTVPMEAGFDENPDTGSIPETIDLLPVVPLEADFEDCVKLFTQIGN
jgi:hypothetical protein